MHVSALVLQLAGAVMLLLYSTRMVRTGFERAAGPALHSLLLGSNSNAARSVATGIGVASLLQSSMAVSLLVAGFATTGAIGLPSALAIMLGADVGTAVVVQFLSLDLAWLTPLLLVTGGVFFLRLSARLHKQIGRIILGIAFILLSLTMIGEATLPLRGAARIPDVVRYLSHDLLAAFVGGALLAFAFHSSVAAILLLGTLCAQAVLPIEAGLPLVLGANAGSAVLALWLTRTSPRQARCLTLANALFRTLVGLCVLLVIRWADLTLWLPGDSAERQLFNFHLIFNLVLLVVSLPLIRPMLRLVDVLVARRPKRLCETASLPSVLDPLALDSPGQALASATRELLRMSETVETMVSPIPDLLRQWQRVESRRIRVMEKHVNAMHTRIKLYIAELNRGRLSVDEARRGIELTSMAINLERVGDIIAKDLLDRIEEKHAERHEFSDDGFREIVALHERVKVNMHLALNVLLSEDLESARQLVIEKARIGQLERETRARHLHRLTRNTPESIATSDLHLEVVRALKEINSLYASVAYPILSKSGQLRDNRLVDSPHGDPEPTGLPNGCYRAVR